MGGSLPPALGPGLRIRGVSWPVSAACDMRWLFSISRSFEDSRLGLGRSWLGNRFGADAEMGSSSPALLLEVEFDSLSSSLLWRCWLRTDVEARWMASKPSSVPEAEEWRETWGFALYLSYDNGG